VKSTISVAEASEARFDGVATWLFGTSALVAGMVSVGGITRLTRSGLSMTDWKPLGGLPPMTLAEWQAEFERYKQFPEFQQRSSMTLEEFKFIYYWEWGHRMLGRFIGLAFALPLGYFVARGRLPSGLGPRLGMLFAMGGTQGLVGWWMVKSGLEVDPKTHLKEIRVSPYRLATHLGMAFATYSLLFHTALDTYYKNNSGAAGTRAATKDAMAALVRAGPQALAAAKRLRWAMMGLGVATFVTAVSGGFVAGNDAGCAYNCFPKMTEDTWLPLEPLFEPSIQPWYRNFFENTPLVQLDHRVLAIGTAGLAIGTHAYAAMAKVATGEGQVALWKLLTPTARRAITATAAVATGQVLLGISTLLLYVPIGLAAAHQAGSLLVLSSSLWGLRSMQFAAVATGAQVSSLPGLLFGASSIGAGLALISSSPRKALEETH